MTRKNLLHVEAFLWPKVRIGLPNECWPWQGAKTISGYGFMVYRRRRCLAHRVVFMLTKGPIPASLFVLHSCDNRLCVNPWHLRVGTPKDNTRDAIERGRFKLKIGPQFTSEETLRILLQKGLDSRGILVS